MPLNKIYIVEDSFITAFHLKRLLEKEGYLILGIADNGETALKEILHMKPDMVLMDIMLDGNMSGIEVGCEMKKNNIPLIYITAQTDKDTIQQAKITEPYGYLIKPFDDTEILTVIEMALYKVAQDKKAQQEFSESILRDKDLAEMNQQMAELRLKALHLAMNPHFIFNTLNAIQFFIVRQDRVSALKYLSIFSKLIRSILCHSGKKQVKLADEIELLKNYVALEQLRFDNKFQFSVHIDPLVKVEEIEIPSLLIQPYLEDAILNGLAGLKEDGQLQLSVTRDGTHLFFTIHDNGINRTKPFSIEEVLSDSSILTIQSEHQLKVNKQNHRAKVELIDSERNKESKGRSVLISWAMNSLTIL